MFRRQFLKIFGLSCVSTLFARKVTAQIPYKKIDLQEVYVAGYQYYAGMNPQVEASLRIGQEIRLVRETDNLYDEKAIEIYTMGGRKLGYYPRKGNEIPTAMLDQDMKIGAIISEVSPTASPWERLTIRAYIEV